MKIEVNPITPSTFSIKIGEGQHNDTRIFLRLDRATLDQRDAFARDEARDYIMEAVAKTKILSSYTRPRVLEEIEAAIVEIFGDAPKAVGARHG